MSSIIRNAVALSAVAAVAAAQGPPPKLDAPCADAVIFMARGNDAPYQDWRTFPFADATCNKLKAQGKTCDFIEIEFETMHNGDFCTQIGTGVRNGQAAIKAFNKKCPCTHLILNGFSQGAWITGDILAGPGGCSQITTGLDSTVAPGNAIAAALLWGDVMHEANMPYNVLDGAGLQKSGRSADSLARLNKNFAGVLRSYCQKGDPICTKGDDVSKHLNYFELYTEDASNWAVEKFNAAAPLCAAPATASSSASSTVAASSTVVASSVAVGKDSAASSTAVGVASGTAVAVASSAAAGVAHGSGAGVAYGTGVAGSYPSAAASASAHALPPAPTSPAHPAPFPAFQPYEPTCVPIMEIEYVYV